MINRTINTRTMW